MQWRKEHKNAYLNILEVTREAISNPDLGLTWVHWPIPHWPYIYDRYGDDFAGLDHPLPTYLDNLELVDRTLKELRLIMENADQWDKTTVILTADHAFKLTNYAHGKADLRVPFLVKLAGEKKEVIYDVPLNTIVIHDLILALLRGDVTSSDGVVHWFDQHPWRSH